MSINTSVLQYDSKSRDSLWRSAITALLAAAAITYVWFARCFFQDDAFIHLRIAKNLHALGFYSFNGDTPTFSTSSPLYTALLAILLNATSTPLLPKFLGITIYLILVTFIVQSSIAAESNRSKWLWIAMLAAIASPLGVRWLCDGMETGLVGITAILAARAAFNIRRTQQAPSFSVCLGYFVFGLCASLLRIEFCLVFAMIGTASLLLQSRFRVDRAVLSLAIGATTGLIAIYAMFGRLLPDTAVAKANGVNALTGTAMLASIIDIAKAHLAASSLGVGIAMLWAYSMFQIIRGDTKLRYSLIINAALPMLLLIIVLRHQAIQGYRYFVFAEFFLVAYNLLVIGNIPDVAVFKVRISNPKSSFAAAAFLMVAMVVWQALDFPRFDSVVTSRSTNFQKFRDAKLETLSGTTGIAWDVGLIGYFANATILDGEGLVNGRTIAKMSERDRLQWYTSHSQISFIFANSEQLSHLRPFGDFRSWLVRDYFDFQNLNGNPDRHYFMVRDD